MKQRVDKLTVERVNLAMDVNEKALREDIETGRLSGPVLGNIRHAQATKTADFIATLDDAVICIDATAGNVTGTLPPAVAAYSKGFGYGWWFKRIDSSGNVVSVQVNPVPGTDLIDGGGGFVMGPTDVFRVETISATAFAFM